MAIDFTLPKGDQAYDALLPYVREHLAGQAKGFEGVTFTGDPPLGAKRLSTLYEEWTSGGWAEKAWSRLRFGAGLWVGSGGTNVFAVDGDTNLSSSPWLKLSAAGLSLFGGTTIKDLAYGTYTPPLIGAVNVDSTTVPAAWSWKQMGKRVDVFGRLAIDASAANTATEVWAELPILSFFTTSYQLGGVIVDSNDNVSGEVVSFTSGSGDVARFLVKPISASNREYSVMFSYQVL